MRVTVYFRSVDFDAFLQGDWVHMMGAGVIDASIVAVTVNPQEIEIAPAVSNPKFRTIVRLRNARPDRGILP